MAEDLAGFGNRLGQAGRNRGQSRPIDVPAAHDDGELVAAEPRHEILAPDNGAQAAGDDLQERVARRMAVRIVDLLEAVEIDPEDGERIGLLQRRKAGAEFLEEAAAVGEPRQRVLAREFRDALGAALLFGDVLMQVDPAPVGERPAMDGIDAAVGRGGA